MGSQSPELGRFVHSALSHGMTRASIAESLLAAGWSQRDIERALQAWADSESPLPVPRPRPGVSPRETWFYLLLFLALYIGLWNLGTLAFQLIEQAFPDPLEYMTTNGRQTTIRWAISWLVICAPLFLALNWRLTRSLIEEPMRRASRVRQWLTALTLFIAASSLMGDLVVLVYNLLDGDLKVRFLLKVAVVALLAGAAFLYYIRDLRSSEELA
ncbi:MAG: hypothetical protein KDC10_04345 [Calditrichaeota bacterium]|nr:hypothetical protein [Candidatus Cloacimonadota bacterium]MCA9787322.1 hypothetical protein [Candidatus Cloacimonadota bacterium]MCB1046411.1 hypothetical protein [Calditrichota bacterium]MCB9472732.1 hypothetical protein [Candidatus Delongbacteria bacterium]